MQRFMLFLLMVFVISALFLSCAAEKTEPISDAMQKQISMLPPNSDMVGYINFDKVKDSEFFKLFMDSVADNPFGDDEYLEFVKRTGLDIQQDIHEMYVVSGSNSENPIEDGFAMVTGNFEPDKLISFIEDKAEDKEIESESFEGHMIYTSPEENKSFCFYNNSTLIAGSDKVVKNWILNSSKNEWNTDDQMLARIKNLKFKDSAWFTMKAEAFGRDINHSQIKKMKGLEDLKTMSISLDFKDSFQLDGHSEFKNKETAKLFKDAVKGFIATGKLSVSEDRDLIDILNSIKVDSDDNRVGIELKLSREEVQKLLDKDNFLPVEVI